MSILEGCSVAQLQQTLYGPLDYSLPGSSAHGIFQTILEWGAIFYSWGPSSQGIHQLDLVSLASPTLAGRFFYH